jgi:Family of unknown function (DUF6644)
MSLVLRLCQYVGDLPSSIALRESIWMYPIIETAHVLGLCLFVGTAALWDLRLLGVTMKSVPVSRLKAQLLPWTVGGSFEMLASGALLVFSDPMRFYVNVFFRIKLVLLLVAGLNALIFHNTIGRTTDDWDLTPSAPLRARIAGGASLTLWTLVIVSGRMIAYNWFNPTAK